MTTAADGGDITAPSLLGMNRMGAALLAFALVASLVTSIIGHFDGVRSVPLLLVSMAIAALSVAGIVMVRSDPMPAVSASLVAAANPLSVLLTCLSLSSPLRHPNQTNVFGIGVVVGAYLCVRGRTRMAWAAVTVSVVIVVVWSSWTGLGPIYGIALAGTAYGVIGMATVFAVLLRPAAETITSLRRSALLQAQDAAATEARLAERVRQRAELRRYAWPVLTKIAVGSQLSVEQRLDVRLLEAQLRDGIRARSLKVPSVIAAARSARARGVLVIMIDDGGMDAAPDDVREALYASACELLDDARAGVVTVRIQPPGRAVLGSVVAEVADGPSTRLDIAADGAITTTT